MTSWINYHAVWKIFVFGLLLGAALPALFAVGVRLNAAGVGVTGGGAVAGGGGAADGAFAGGTGQRNPVLIALSWVIFALVLAAVIVGVLFIARDFIGSHLGLYILGAKHK